MNLFADIKAGFGQIVGDRRWLPKVFLGGLLLINPGLIALAPLWARDHGDRPGWLVSATLAVLAVNVLTFWFPLGFTYEVLRRARSGGKPQLPDWDARLLLRYGREGAVKLVIAVFTLIVPVGLWMGLMWALFVWALDWPPTVLSMMYAPALLVAIPFCGVACSRWLDGDSVLACALGYAKTARIFMRRPAEFLLASLLLTGLNTVACAWVYTIPFAAVFGLCLVDTWLGPIYADAAGPAKKLGDELPLS